MLFVGIFYLQMKNDEMTDADAVLMEEVRQMKKWMKKEFYYDEVAPKRQRSEEVILCFEVSKTSIRPFYERLPKHIHWSWGSVPQTIYMMVQIMKHFLPTEILDGLLYVDNVEEVNDNKMMVSFMVLKEVKTEFTEWVRKNLFSK